MKKLLKYIYIFFLILIYAFFWFLALITTIFLRIEYISITLLILYFLSILGLFFVKKTPLLSIFPSLLFFIILGVFYYVDSEDKWSICSYTHEWIVGECECDGYVIYQANFWTCRGDRITCTISQWYPINWIDEISCKDHRLPTNFLWK